MRGRIWLALTSSLCVSTATTACSIQYRPKIQYSGLLTSALASCPETHGTLTIQRSEVTFAPDDGTWILEGKAVGMAVEANRSRPSFDHKTYATEFKATLTDTQAIGTYMTPTCRYAVNLNRF